MATRSSRSARGPLLDRQRRLPRKRRTDVAQCLRQPSLPRTIPTPQSPSAKKRSEPPRVRRTPRLLRRSADTKKTTNKYAPEIIPRLDRRTAPARPGLAHRCNFAKQAQGVAVQDTSRSHRQLWKNQAGHFQYAATPSHAGPKHLDPVATCLAHLHPSHPFCRAGRFPLHRERKGAPRARKGEGEHAGIETAPGPPSRLASARRSRTAAGG